jgi:hypothetical protein
MVEALDHIIPTPHPEGLETNISHIGVTIYAGTNPNENL